MDPFLGQIQAFGFNFAPRGWAKCEGQLLAISQYSAVFSLLGTTFGGDGRTTFGLPDLRSRSIVGIGQGPGLDRITWGERGGAFQVHLQANNLPPHHHSVSVPVNNQGGDEAISSGQVIANHAGAFSEESVSGQALKPFNTANDGGQNTPIYSRNPFLGINVCIALQGIFPSRN